MKKNLITFLILAAISGSNLVVFAAPETMPDGTVFDAEYYSETYPDLKAAFGNDAAALYNHYVQYGRAEGRQAAADGIAVQTAVTETVSVQNQSVLKCDLTTDDANNLFVVNPYCNIRSGKVSGKYSSFQRGDYSNEPLYLALEKKLLDETAKAMADSNYYSTYPHIYCREYVDDINILEMDNAYIVNVVGNLMVDYYKTFWNGKALKQRGGNRFINVEDSDDPDSMLSSVKLTNIFLGEATEDTKYKMIDISLMEFFE